jgi:hypothetical protein
MQYITLPSGRNRILVGGADEEENEPNMRLFVNPGGAASMEPIKVAVRTTRTSTRMAK